MTPTASAHTIVISPGTKLVTVPNPTSVGMAFSGESAVLPKYAIGLFESNGSGPRKRKRLTHLTPEEKVMRRKLKNRVAAQTARDRKRMKMESLEETVQKIQLQAKELLDVNLKLLERAEALERENAELRHRLGLCIDENPVVSGNRREMERIKVEFDDTVLLNFEPAVPDSLLSPDESSDESETGSRISFIDKSDLTRLSSDCVTTMECASPKPAVFGEHGLERLIPPQQEAVKHSLIRSKVEQTISPLPVSSEKIKKTTFLACSRKSDPTSKRKTGIRIVQVKALDLTLRPPTKTE